MCMEAALPSVRTFRKRRGDAATETLIRLVVSTKQAYREPLLDVLYQYRRREGYFDSAPKVLLTSRRRLPIRITGVGPHARVETGGLTSPTVAGATRPEPHWSARERADTRG